MLHPQHCRARQRRLIDAVRGQNLDAVVVGLVHHVYYVGSVLPRWFDQAACAIFADGRSALIWPGRLDAAGAVDEVRVAQVVHRQDQTNVMADQVLELLKSRGARRIGIDGAPVTAHVAARLGGDAESIEPTLWQLRRRKDPDELELMRAAIRCTQAMHRRAREIIEPGISELRVYSELIQVGVETAGEPLTNVFGNDYASGVPGGPARNRTAQAGELYILDLGPSFRGYFADNCRAYAVDRKPTDEQMKTWSALNDVFPLFERLAKPGASTLDLFNAVSEHLQQRLGKPLGHHLGHGVGLLPQELPHMKPDWNGTLIEGEVITAEPGMYGATLKGGIRLENQYLVTKDGVENLTPFPMELV